MVFKIFLKFFIINFGGENVKLGIILWMLICNKVWKVFEEYGCFVVMYDKVFKCFYDKVLDVV